MHKLQNHYSCNLKLGNDGNYVFLALLKKYYYLIIAIAL